MENVGATVSFTDYSTGEVKEVYIEEVKYFRVNQPSLGKREGSGGICYVNMRTV